MSRQSEAILVQDSLRLAPVALGLGSIVLLCLFAPPVAHGQYRFDSWTTDNGLPQNSVRSILQTRDGYLWLATSDGLVRFDAVHFTVFNKGTSPGINSNRFSCLAEDGDGVLWAGTEDGGLTRYQNGKFKSYTVKEGLPNDRVEAIRVETNGELTIATMWGLSRHANGEFIPYTSKAGEPREVFG